jgi:hypothetical protein
MCTHCFVDSQPAGHCLLVRSQQSDQSWGREEQQQCGWANRENCLFKKESEVKIGATSLDDWPEDIIVPGRASGSHCSFPIPCTQVWSFKS